MQKKKSQEEKFAHENYEPNQLLNSDITLEEVSKAVECAKLRKASGIEGLSNEVLKTPKLLQFLTHFMQVCFKSSIVPSDWYKSLIKPIPKSAKNDPRVPLNYRGVSLLSTVSKLFSNILNCRLSQYLEAENILEEEQNGFRKHRSCLDHIYTLSTVIRARISEGKSTFVLLISEKLLIVFTEICCSLNLFQLV